MAQARRASRERGAAGRIELVDLGDRERPQLEVALIDPAGGRKPLDVDKDGTFALDEKLVGKGFRIEVGLPGMDVRRYRYDFVVDEAVLRIPQPVWSKWFPFTSCVTGRVRVCRFRRPWEAEIGTIVQRFGLHSALTEIATPVLPSPLFRLCRPVCQGRVEVYVRTCCCPPITVHDPPVVIKNICEIIDCREIVFPRDPGDPGPEIGPRPGPGPDPAPLQAIRALRPGPDAPGDDGDEDLDAPLAALHEGVELAVKRAIKRSEASEGGLPASDLLRLAGHLTTLLRLSPADRVGYLERFPELHFALCHCSSSHVATVPLQSDGHFDACFRLLPTILLRNCSQRVLYRVSQFQAGSWVTVYDDFAAGRSHAFDEDPVLYAGTGTQACDDDDEHEWGERPFALLERIGTGYHANLMIHSTEQAGEDSWTAPFQAHDGLVNPPPLGPPPGVTDGPYDQPWGDTLALRYAFHPDLPSTGAAFYRTRAVRLDAAGHAVPGSDVLFDESLSWGRYVGIHVEWVELRHVAVGGVDGLYTIPDHASSWLDAQYHALIRTSALTAGGTPRMPGGRYAFLLELYDSAGHRLVPDNTTAGPADIAAAFEYRRLTGPLDVPFTNIAVVPQRALGNLFLVDNSPAFADLEAINHNGSPSATNCQFLVGPAGDTVSLQYSAYQSTGYQWYHRISIKQGLTGPTTTPVTDSANVFHGSSPDQTFSSLLRPPGFPPETKCAFAAGLVTRVRHTNGSGRLSGYDRDDTAAFALEISPP